MISAEEFDARMLAERKKQLFVLMELKTQNKGIEIKGLDNRIIDAKVVLRQEDVAWIEKLIREEGVA